MKNLIQAAFEKPVKYPPINQIVYPGDKVTIVPDPFVISRPDLLVAFVTSVTDLGISAGDISLLLLEQETKLFETPIRKRLPKVLRDEVRIVSHDSQRQNDLAMLAVAKNDSPIKLNRCLVDADVVIPIERHEAALGMGYFGMQSVIYPRFADSETQKRFLFAEAKKNSQKLLMELAGEVTEVVFALGVIMTVQILANLQGEIIRIIFGDTVEIQRLLAKKGK
ncbi:MAG: lactate racemase domain-containing protein [Planctomycetaceae bacterium]|nr:lactate racemase domain-containing protein [Planctomycetaceae bacterium]